MLPFTFLGIFTGGSIVCTKFAAWTDKLEESEVETEASTVENGTAETRCRRRIGWHWRFCCRNSMIQRETRI